MWLSKLSRSLYMIHIRFHSQYSPNLPFPQCLNSRILRFVSGLWWAIKSSMSACTTSIDEPLRSAGKDIRLKCAGVEERLEKRGRNFVGLSVMDASLIELWFSDWASFGLANSSFESKLFIDWVVMVFFSAVAVCPTTSPGSAPPPGGFSTIVMARRSKQARLWVCSFFFRCAWASLKSFKEQRRESKFIVWCSFSSRD